jgi:hypothetical protein
LQDSSHLGRVLLAFQLFISCPVIVVSVQGSMSVLVDGKRNTVSCDHVL